MLLTSTLHIQVNSKLGSIFHLRKIVKFYLRSIVASLTFLRPKKNHQSNHDILTCPFRKHKYLRAQRPSNTGQPPVKKLHHWSVREKKKYPQNKYGGRRAKKKWKKEITWSRYGVGKRIIIYDREKKKSGSRHECGHSQARLVCWLIVSLSSLLGGCCWTHDKLVFRVGATGIESSGLKFISLVKPLSALLRGNDQKTWRCGRLTGN